MSDYQNEFEEINWSILTRRALERLLDGDIVRYSHRDINGRIRDLINSRGWVSEVTGLRTSFIFEAPEMEINVLENIFIDAGIIGELILETDDYLFSKLLQNNYITHNGK